MFSKARILAWASVIDIVAGAKEEESGKAVTAIGFGIGCCVDGATAGCLGLS